MNRLQQLVLDASVALAWCFDDEANRFTEGVLDLIGHGGTAVVPAVWPLEVVNALLSAERRKRVTEAKTASFLRQITALPITVESIALAGAHDIAAVARRYKLTSYDAAYLELALRSALPLATLDDGLRRAAQAAGIDLI